MYKSSRKESFDCNNALTHRNVSFSDDYAYVYMYTISGNLAPGGTGCLLYLLGIKRAVLVHLRVFRSHNRSFLNTFEGFEPK